MFLRPVEARRLEVGVSSRFSGSFFRSLAHFLTWEHPFAERSFCLRQRNSHTKKNVFFLLTKAIALRAPARPG
jgi:hypothetical protein